MKSSNQVERESYRLIITRRNASEILFTSTESGWSLPQVEILPRRRVSEQLTTEAEFGWTLKTYCLFIPGFATRTGDVRPANYAVMESIKQNDKAPLGTVWTSVASGNWQTDSPEDNHAIEESLRELDSYDSESKAGRFGRPAWLKELFSWTQEQLTPLGLRVNGNFRQIDSGPTFSLVRLETNGPAVWFKATGEPNLHELPITLCLARLFPESLPPILGIHPSWNGWLSEEVSDTTLDQCTDLSAWERTAASVAELQIASIGKSSALLNSQCKDLRLPGLIDLVPRFLSRMAELMAIQVKQSPPPLTVSELESLGTRLREALLLLQNIGLPDTLGHIDFNPGNIVVSPARCVFLDWAEACVTNPFVTFEYLREHARRNLTQVTTASVRIATAYLLPWTTLLSPDDVALALTVSPLIAVFIYAVATSGWCSPETLRSPTRSGYLRSLARRMHSEVMLRAKGENNETFNSPLSNQPAVFQFPV